MVSHNNFLTGSGKTADSLLKKRFSLTIEQIADKLLKGHEHYSIAGYNLETGLIVNAALNIPLRSPDRPCLLLTFDSQVGNGGQVGLCYVFDIKENSIAIHFDHGGKPQAMPYRWSVEERGALGNNFFLNLLANLRDTAKELGIEKIEFEVENVAAINDASIPHKTLGILLRSGVALEPKLHEYVSQAGLHKRLARNRTICDMVMSTAEKAAYDDAIKDLDHIDFQAIASFPTRLYYNPAEKKNPIIRIASHADRNGDPKHIFMLGDVLLNGLMAEKTLTLDEIKHSKLERILNRTRSSPAMR